MDFWGPPDTAAFMPQGDDSAPALVWLEVGADLGVGLACVAVAAVLGWAVRRGASRRVPRALRWVGGAALLCGATQLILAMHLLLTPQVWTGQSALSVGSKYLILLLFWGAAVVLWPSIRRALATGTPPELGAEPAELVSPNTALAAANPAPTSAASVAESTGTSGERSTPAPEEPARIEPATSRARLQAAETTARELQRLAMAMSHDLRGPLRNIEMALEIATVELEAGVLEEAPVLVPMAWRRTVDLRALTEDLLAYCRDAWSHHPTEAVDVHGLVARAARIGQVVGGPAMHVAAMPMRVLVEAAPLETVVRNLVCNAVKHHHQPDRGSVWIRLSRGLGPTSESDDGCVIIDVEDDGPGIDATLHDAVFRLFRRGATAADGTGLGLALAQTVVERHGGTIELQDRAGGGCWFRVCWPIGDAGPELRPR